MSRKGKDDHYAGMALIVVFLVLAVIDVYSAFNNSSILTTAIFSIIAGLFGVLGFGSFANETINDWTWRIFKNLSGGDEKESSTRADSHNKQVQKNANRSPQINAGNNAKIEINQNGTDESVKGEAFSCPNGHNCFVSPPDNVHTTASVDEETARDNAQGKVIPRKVTCKKCQKQFKLYWY